MLSVVALSEQGLPGKDGETGAAGPPGPAVSTSFTTAIGVLYHQIKPGLLRPTISRHLCLLSIPNTKLS